MYVHALSSDHEPPPLHWFGHKEEGQPVGLPWPSSFPSRVTSGSFIKRVMKLLGWRREEEPRHKQTLSYLESQQRLVRLGPSRFLDPPALRPNNPPSIQPSPYALPSKPPSFSVYFNFPRNVFPLEEKIFLESKLSICVNIQQRVGVYNR